MAVRAVQRETLLPLRCRHELEARDLAALSALDGRDDLLHQRYSLFSNCTRIASWFSISPSSFATSSTSVINLGICSLMACAVLSAMAMRPSLGPDHHAAPRPGQTRTGHHRDVSSGILAPASPQPQ